MRWGLGRSWSGVPLVRGSRSGAPGPGLLVRVFFVRRGVRSSGALVREVLGEPDGAGGVPEDGDADVGEGAAEDVLAVTVVGRLLVEHGLGEADRHPGDGRGVACHWAALADVLTGRCPVDSGGGLA